MLKAISEGRLELGVSGSEELVSLRPSPTPLSSWAWGFATIADGATPQTPTCSVHKMDYGHQEQLSRPSGGCKEAQSLGVSSKRLKVHSGQPRTYPACFRIPTPFQPRLNIQLNTALCIYWINSISPGLQCHKPDVANTWCYKAKSKGLLSNIGQSKVETLMHQEPHILPSKESTA